MEPPPEAGERFLAEIREQPRAIRALLEHESEIASVAGRLAASLPADVVVLNDNLDVERVLVGGDELVAC